MGKRTPSAAGVVLAIVTAGWTVTAQTPPRPDPSTAYGLAGGAGAATPAYLRIHHPLYLLDLVRQVRSGAMDAALVAPMVGGMPLLQTLLQRDLDGLYATLTGPQNLRAPASLWQQLVTGGGTAAPLLPDPPNDLDLGSLAPGEQRSEMVVLTAATDGVMATALPAGSPFQILSLRTYDGQIVSAITGDPAGGGTPILKRLDAAAGIVPGNAPTFLTSTASRAQAPWALPVQAGQDIGIEIGPRAGISPGDVSSSLVVGDITGAWRNTIGLVAKVTPLPVNGGIYVYLNQPLGPIPVVRPPSYVPGDKIPFTLPVTLTCCFPQVDATGTIALTSGPAGLGMTPVNFSISAGQTLTIPLTLSIDTLGAAWFAPDFSGQGFSIGLTYHSVPLAAAGFGSGSLTKSFTLYPGSKNWTSHGNAGPIDCQEDTTLFSNGSYAISSTCGNYNIFPGKATIDVFLGLTKVFSTAYGLNPYERQYASLSSTSAMFQSNYLTWIAQQMISMRKGCLLCNF